MRLKQNRVKTLYVMPRTVTKDSEGVPTESFGTAFSVSGIVWPATSKRQVETYGDRVTNISNIRVEGDYQLTDDGKTAVTSNGSIHLGDGVRVYSDAEPDYKVISITGYDVLLLEVERRV